MSVELATTLAGTCLFVTVVFVVIIIFGRVGSWGSLGYVCQSKSIGMGTIVGCVEWVEDYCKRLCAHLSWLT